MGWTPETVARLTESEASKLAIIFEESWAYEYRERKKAESGSSGVETGAGFEEVFSFGEEDYNDYWDRPDITQGIPIPD